MKVCSFSEVDGACTGTGMRQDPTSEVDLGEQIPSIFEMEDLAESDER